MQMTATAATKCTRAQQNREATQHIFKIRENLRKIRELEN